MISGFTTNPTLMNAAGVSDYLGFAKKVVSVTKKYMQHSLEISVARTNLASENVQHIFYMVQAKDRYEVIKRIPDIR